jgi:hypothetical protein
MPLVQTIKLMVKHAKLSHVPWTIVVEKEHLGIWILSTVFLILDRLVGTELMLQITPMVVFHEFVPKPTAVTKALDTTMTWRHVCSLK